MSDQWFIVRPDREEGPYNLIELSTRAGDGRLNPEDLIRRIDQTEPVTARTIKDQLLAVDRRPASRVVQPNHVSSQGVKQVVNELWDRLRPKLRRLFDSTKTLIKEATKPKPAATQEGIPNTSDTQKSNRQLVEGIGGLVLICLLAYGGCRLMTSGFGGIESAIYGGVPDIEPDQTIRLAKIELSDWRRESAWQVTGRIQFNSLSSSNFQVQYHLYGAAGDKLDEGVVTVPTLQTGEVGKCVISNSDLGETARIVIRVAMK
ncbi:MAG: DUF4339 domain-containing protein [Planctomycetes bacterium]|nr:DUF4339 domain-containing protein [Planctomycetota bacterium]